MMLPHRPKAAWPANPTTVGPTTQVNRPRSFFSMSSELQESALHPLAEDVAERDADQDADGRAGLAEPLPQGGREHRGADEPAHDPHEPGRRLDLSHNRSTALRSSESRNHATSGEKSII